MRTFVESLKRLYKLNKVTESKLSELVSSGSLTQEELEYITK